LKIEKKQEDCLDLAIKVIGQIGEASALGANLETLKSVSVAFEEIWDILVSHNLQFLALRLISRLEKILETCRRAEEGTEPFDLGVEQISELRNRLDMMAEHKPKWKRALERLRTTVL